MNQIPKEFIWPHKVDFGSFPTIDYTGANLVLVKERKKTYDTQDHSRWIYYDEEKELYLKVWDHTYVRRDNLPLALRCGFYDHLIPAFQGMIVHNSVCRGYVMRRCEKLADRKHIADEALSILKERTQKTGLFAYDYLDQGVMEFKGRPCLIDLEGVYKVREYRMRKIEHEEELKTDSRFMKNPDYQAFVENEYQKMLLRKKSATWV